jgi:hypothetical protein
MSLLVFQAALNFVPVASLSNWYLRVGEGPVLSPFRRAVCKARLRYIGEKLLAGLRRLPQKRGTIVVEKSHIQDK